MNQPNISSYYKKSFVENSDWNTSYPNKEEVIRSGKILYFLSGLMKDIKSDVPIRIVDVGCGRGWLSFLMSSYGNVTGIDPVESVIKHARKLYPHLEFFTATPEQHLKSSSFTPYDVVVCSEVIEHVPYNDQKDFLESLFQLLKPKGYLILTTPRGELFNAWKANTASTQPIEDWLTEKMIDNKLKESSFSVLKRDRCIATNFYCHPLHFFHGSLIKRVMSVMGFCIDESKSMIYQVILAQKLESYSQ